LDPNLHYSFKRLMDTKVGVVATVIPSRDIKRAKHGNSIKKVEADLELLAMDSELSPLSEFPRLDELPSECISHIFAFFSFEELNALSSVAKKWHHYCWGFQELIAIPIPRRHKLRDAHLKYLPKCTELKAINLHGSRLLTDEALKIVSQLPKLAKLNLSFCIKITDNGIRYLRTMTSIRSLLLSYCQQLTSKSLEHLAALTTLRDLDLSGCNISDEGLNHLCALTDLQNLDLTFNKVTREGIEMMKPNPDLQLKYTTIGAKDLPPIPGSHMDTKGSMYPSTHHDPRYHDDSDEDSFN